MDNLELNVQICLGVVKNGIPIPKSNVVYDDNGTLKVGWGSILGHRHPAYIEGVGYEVDESVLEDLAEKDVRDFLEKIYISIPPVGVNAVMAGNQDQLYFDLFLLCMPAFYKHRNAENLVEFLTNFFGVYFQEYDYGYLDMVSVLQASDFYDEEDIYIMQLVNYLTENNLVR